MHTLRNEIRSLLGRDIPRVSSFFLSTSELAESVESVVRCSTLFCLVIHLAPFLRANFSKWLTMLEAPSVHPSR